MKYDLMHKNVNDTLPNGFERYKFFSCSHKFTRLRNGTNKHKTNPKVSDFQVPYSVFFEVYGIIVKENKKRYTIIPYID